MLPLWFSILTLAAGALTVGIAKVPRNRPFKEGINSGVEETIFVLLKFLFACTPLGFFLYFLVAVPVGLVTGEVGSDVLDRLPWQVADGAIIAYVLLFSVAAGWLWRNN